MREIVQVILNKYEKTLGSKRVNVLRMKHGFPPYDKPHTLKEISIKYKVGQARVRKVENQTTEMIINLIKGV